MSRNGRLFVVLIGRFGGCAGGAWLSGAVLVLLGPDGGWLDAAVALISVLLLALIARSVFKAGGIWWLLAYIVAALYGALLVPLVIG